jgi:hypothetical protein
VIRFAPVLVLVLVTTLLLGYGPHSWSWLAGPVAALSVWSFGREHHAPGVRAAPAHRRRAPAAVD